MEKGAATTKLVVARRRNFLSRPRKAGRGALKDVLRMKRGRREREAFQIGVLRSEEKVITVLSATKAELT